MEEITISRTQLQRNLMEWSRRMADCCSIGLLVTRIYTEHA